MELALTSSFILLIACIVSIYKYMRLKKHADELQKEVDLYSGISDDLIQFEANADATPDKQRLDALTGLPHRQVFEDRIEQLLQQGERDNRLFSIIAIDIDNFSKVSELGFDAGDEVIKQLSLRLQMSIRQVDTLSRLGGASFLLLLPVLSRPETSIYVAQRIQDNLLEPFFVGNKEISITVSMGIAVYPIDGHTSLELLQHANHALTQAKESGKNQYHFYQTELHNLGSKELSIAEFIRSKDFITNLRIQFKPFFDVEKNTPHYIQAATHLHHPQHGMIALTDIIEVTENSGRMLEVNNWLLTQAINQLKAWKEQDFNPVYLALPTRMHQLENTHFVHEIIECSKKLKQMSIYLILDIEDNQVTQNTNFLGKLFTQLGEEEIQIAVGVQALGNFAMQKFNRIPLQYLKIDRTFVKDSANNDDKNIILSQIVQLADNENIIVMAEGVDNEADKQRLMKINCSLMEGKLFGYLMPTGSVLHTPG